MMRIASSRLWPGCVLFLAAATAHAGILRRGPVQLMCHRTANRDLPENTLESLALAARMGCDIVEVDVTRTLDGQLVLNHDNFLDRFTNSTGEVEHTDLRELDRMDFGEWRGTRFRGMRIAHFDDALRLAREMGIGLYLDLKSKGIGEQVLAALAQERMSDRVIFGGEWDDVKRLCPRANEIPTADVQPGVSAETVRQLHEQGKYVIAGFIFNGHEADLPAMRAAVAAGVDAIMVDYPRLGAEAVGRPVEARLGRLAARADRGSSADRVAAIREISYFTGFPLQKQFLRWMQDPDAAVSHEAALALVSGRPAVSVAALEPLTRAPGIAARHNAAWAIGSVAGQSGSASIGILLPMLADSDPSVVQEALLALTWCPGSGAVEVPAATLLPFLSGPVPVMRGLAAVALAKFHPALAATVVTRQLEKEQAEAAAYDVAWAARGRPQLTRSEIDVLIERYRAQMKMVQALASLPTREAFSRLVEQAFRPVDHYDYSNVTALVAGYQLWDRLAADPQPAIDALNSSDAEVADRAEWALIEAGPDVLPALRGALEGSSGAQRRRLISALGWQADADAIPALQRLKITDTADAALIEWAVGKIRSVAH